MIADVCWFEMCECVRMCIHRTNVCVAKPHGIYDGILFDFFIFIFCTTFSFNEGNERCSEW